MPHENTPEPTNRDIMGALHSFVEVVTERLDTVDERLTTIDRRFGVLEEDVAEIKDTVGAMSEAFDKDAVTLIDQERRIAKLEAA